MKKDGSTKIVKYRTPENGFCARVWPSLMEMHVLPAFLLKSFFSTSEQRSDKLEP